MKKIFLLIAFVLLALAHYRALYLTPPDRMMGDVYRILFVHVPAAWMAMLLFFGNFIASGCYLWKKSSSSDFLAQVFAEIGLAMTGLALALGSLWAKPTWGLWWTWDPRLTTTALLFLLYSGYLILRELIDDPDKRAKLSGSLALLIFFNVPIVYLSVRWWRSLHQVQSSPETMAPEMVLTLRLSALALLAVALALTYCRWQQRPQKEGGPL